MKRLLSDSSTRVKAFYEDKKRYQPIIAFFAGFTWDSFTLTRIDLLIDNLVMFAYVVLSGFFIYLINLVEEDIIEKQFLIKYKNWYPNIIQFFFGGLFSAYVVYYFQSASLSKNWLFLLFLVVLLVINEFIKGRLNNLSFLFSVYYLATFSFFIFYLPVLFKTISAFIFILSGFVSTAFVAGLIFLLYTKLKDQLKSRIKNLVIIIASIYCIFNILYFTNIIPPVPLSLKEAGIFHHIERDGDKYLAQFEKGSWYEPFKESDDVYHYKEGDLVYCFASVFAPTDLDTRIYHRWQYYDENRDEWIASDRTSYHITGGRDEGYRGYTNKRNVRPGLWQVDVETEREQLLGRISFEIEAAQDSVILETIEK